MRTLWLLLSTWVLLFQSSAAKHGTRLPSAMVVGTVYCDTCFHKKFTKTSYFISEASVAVQCKDPGGKAGFKKEAKTNTRGQFEVHLPFRIAKDGKSIRTCSVELVNSSKPHCSIPSTTTSAILNLKSSKQGVPIFSAGFFAFRPLAQPDLCLEKPNLNPPKGPKTTFSALDAKENDLSIFLPFPPITIGTNPFFGAPPPPVLHSDPLQPPFYNFPTTSPPPKGFSIPLPQFSFPNAGPMFPGVPPAAASNENLP